MCIGYFESSDSFLLLNGCSHVPFRGELYGGLEETWGWLMQHPLAAIEIVDQYQSILLQALITHTDPETLSQLNSLMCVRDASRLWHHSIESLIASGLVPESIKNSLLITSIFQKYIFHGDLKENILPYAISDSIE